MKWCVVSPCGSLAYTGIQTYCVYVCVYVQAWIVFKDITCATNAKREMQNFMFYERPMAIEYAKGKSDAVAKADGTYR